MFRFFARLFNWVPLTLIGLVFLYGAWDAAKDYYIRSSETPDLINRPVPAVSVQDYNGDTNLLGEVAVYGRIIPNLGIATNAGDSALQQHAMFLGDGDQQGQMIAIVVTGSGEAAAQFDAIVSLSSPDGTVTVTGFPDDLSQAFAQDLLAERGINRRVYAITPNMVDRPAVLTDRANDALISAIIQGSLGVLLLLWASRRRNARRKTKKFATALANPASTKTPSERSDPDKPALEKPVKAPWGDAPTKTGALTRSHSLESQTVAESKPVMTAQGDQPQWIRIKTPDEIILEVFGADAMLNRLIDSSKK